LINANGGPKKVKKLVPDDAFVRTKDNAFSCEPPEMVKIIFIKRGKGKRKISWGELKSWD